jgi:HTH-type transcriptional regulator, transcriptional repressor of NAD biosynthesis genes
VAEGAGRIGFGFGFGRTDGGDVSVKHALIVGKFYPPHLGHQYLISEAARRAEEVTVLVMAARRETVPLADRVAWLREAFAAHAGVAVVGVTCDAPVDYDDDRVWDAQVAVMRSALAQAGRPPVDAVFSSEHYGAELARRLRAAHVAVDIDRQSLPVSATRIRASLHENWDWLIGPARAGLAVRVVVLGAESTGTTTVAGLLAEHYRARGGAFAATPCVGEYGRDYTAIKWAAARTAARLAGQPEPTLDEITWDAADFDIVAREQTRRENAAAASGVPLVVCDTDAFATSVWERRYLARAARGLQPWAAAELPHHDLYLLTTHEGVPWHDDGMREGDLEIRAAMTGWFAAALTDAGHSWLPLTGTLAQRSRLAVRAVDLALADRASFGPSITQLSEAYLGN